MMLTVSSSSPLSVSMTSEMCSRKPGRFSNSSMERTSSFRFSSRPAASAQRSLLPHLGVAALVEHDLGQLVVRQRVLLRAPAVEAVDQVAQRVARLRLQLVGRGDRARGLGQRHALLARVVVQHLDGGVAKPALGHVDDALEGEIVGRRVDDAQIGQRVADLGALVEARAADHAIGQAERDEAVFELAHLERGAHQDGDLVERCGRCAAAASISSPTARASSSESQEPVTVTFSPGTSSVRSVLPSRPSLCAIRCEAAARIWPVRAVIPLQPDHLGAGEVVLEAQDVVDLGAAPAVDRLIVIADAADVLRRRPGAAIAAAGLGLAPASRR